MKRSLAFRTILLVLSLVLTMIPMFVIGSSAAEQTATMAYTGSTTGNMTGNNDAATVGLDKNLFTVIGNKGSTSNNVGLNKAGQIRLYGHASGNGSYLTVTIAEGYVIKSIVVTFTNTTNNKNCQLSVGDSDVVFNGSSTTWRSDINSNSFTLKNVTGGTTQIYVKSVAITYEAVAATTYNASFVVPDGATVPETINGLGITLPDAVEAPAKYNAQEYEFAGWSTSIVNDTGTAPALLAPGASVTLSADTTYYATYKYKSGEETTTVDGFVATNVADIQSTDVVVIAIKQSNGNYYAMSNDKGTSAAPAAVAITVANNQISGTVADNLKWNVSNSSGNLTIYPNGTTAKWLYCTATNNGVRVGTNTNKTFTIDSSSGYLKHTGTSRYLGVYNSQDWRCYTNTTGNTANQTLYFFVEKSETTTVVSYNYTTTLEVGCTHENTTTVDTATCTEAGTITVTCDDCEAVISTGASPAIGHNYGGDGICTGCGISNHTCNYVATVTPPTCTEAGYTTYACSCGLSYVDDEVAALGHDYEATVTDPTCTAVGYTTYVCSECDDAYTDNEVAALGHDWDEGAVTTTPTCTSTGVKTYTCSECGETKTENLPKADHSYKCGICTVCGAEQSSGATVDFSTTDQRLSQNADSQVWANGGVTITNNKGSGSEIIDSSNPVRFYKNSQLVIAASGMTSIKFTCNTAAYATALKDSIVTVDGVTVDVNDKVVTVTFATSVDEFTITISGGQVRVDEITVSMSATATHTWGDGVETTAPTCTEDGVMTYTCSVCGETKTESIPATGHVDTTTVTVNATCTENGSVTVTCSCGEVVSIETLPATGHNFGNDGKCQNDGCDAEEECEHTYESTVTAPTCTEDGYTTHTCSKCGDEYTDSTVAATGHNYNSCGKCQNNGCGAAAITNVTTDVVVGDYASENGWTDATKYTEIVLNEIITATVTGGGNTGKYYENGYNWRLYQSDDATLTISSDGKIIVSVKITYTSSNTGVLVLNNENIASDTVVEVNSTSITFSVGNSGSATDGQARITAIEVVYVDSAYTHNWGEGVETTAPTCTEDGVMTYTCSVCGDSYTVVIPATGHVDTTTVTVDATCTEDGSETVTCSCGEVVSSKVLNATGHHYKSVVTKPTCISGGYTTHTCSGCGDSYVDSETEITDHNYKSEVTKASNCTETGITTYTCSVCGDSYTEEIPTNGRHVYDENSYVVTKEPTCTEKGEKKGVCTLCETEGRLEIPMIDHSFVDGACEFCGHVDSSTVDFSGRYYIAGIRSGIDEKTYRYICGILTESTTKRYSLVDSGSEDIPSGVFASQADGMLTFVITKCDDGSYVIYVEGVDGDIKYLGWDSVKADNNGILVTEAEALHLAITVNNNGLYNLTFVDGEGNTRYLALNNTVDYAYAAWYKSGNQIQNLALIPIVEEAVIAGAQLNIGTDLTMKYHVALAEGTDISDYFMRFTINGESFDVYNYTVVNGKYVFAFSGIVPQCMGDNILAEVLLIDSETVVAVKDNYSIKAYADRMLDKYGDNAELAQLLRDLLKYGAEAQKYRGHNTDNLVSTGAPGYSNTTPTEADMNRSLTTAAGKTTDNVSFTAAGVRFDYVNNIYVKIKTDDVENVKVVVNGLTELELLETGTAGVYVAYSGGISALDFAEVVTFTVYYNGELIQTLTYTVNSYACDKYEDANIGNLVTALYNYGKSAVAYADANK